MAPRGRAAVAEAIRTATGPILVCAHERPDGDAVGSILGLTMALRKLGLTALPRLADDSPIHPAYRELPGASELRAADASEACDVVVALDVTGPERLGGARPIAAEADTVVLIDHHPDTDEFGTHVWLDDTAPAVGGMIWELLPLLGVDPDPEIAACLYMALMTDTGRFQHDNTTPRALHLAADMAQAGADPSELSRAVYQSRSSAAMALVGRVLARAALVNDEAVAYSWVDDEDFADLGVDPAEVEDLVDWVRMTSGPRIALLAKVSSTETRLSLRSKDGTDVGAVARSLGGGGHRAAAGATVEGDLDDALRAVLPLLADSLE